MLSITDLDIPLDVKNDIRMVVNTLLEKFSFNINKTILFGSFAIEKYQPDSDIDIMVALNVLPDIKQRRLYKQAVDIDRDIDLLFCTKEQLVSNVFAYRHINEKGVVLYEQL